MDAAAAAAFASMVFLGITLGRAISGFLAMRYSDQQMIRSGMILTALGLLMLLIPGSASLAVFSYLSGDDSFHPADFWERALAGNHRGANVVFLCGSPDYATVIWDCG